MESRSHPLKHYKIPCSLRVLVIPNILEDETNFKPQASRMGGLFVGSRTD